MKIVVCGSMTFAKEMMDIKELLKDHDVIIPKNTEKYVAGTMEMENNEEKIKLDIIKKYFDEIKECDAILIINKEKNNIPNYIGGNSLIEMAFAHVLDKKIYLTNPIPKMSYTDEIEAMNPVVLNDIKELK